MTRSTSFILWAVALVIASWLMLFGKAHANGYTPPTPTPPANGDITADLDASAKAAAAAAAAAQAEANATGIGLGVGTGVGVGGEGGAGGDSKAAAKSYGGGATMIDQSSSRTYLLPAPVWTQVPQAAGCIVTNSGALAGGWSFISGSRSDQKSDPVCVGIIMAKAAYDHCHFESEYLITNRIYNTIFPNNGDLPMAPGTRNHTLAECEDLKRPRLTITPIIAAPPAVVVPAPIPAPVATQVCPEPKKLASKPVIKPKRPVLTCPVPLVPAK